MACRRWYTVYRADTDEVVAMGSSRQCAQQMGITEHSFLSLLVRERAKRSEGRPVRYEILAEQLDAEEWAALTGEE